MKILLISDTHGDISKVIEILDRVKGIDMILHCGDYETDARILENCTDIPVISVTGNCDGGSDYRKTVETPAGKLLITHGHMEAVGFTQTPSDVRRRRGGRLHRRLLRAYPRSPLRGHRRTVADQSRQPDRASKGLQAFLRRPPVRGKRLLSCPRPLRHPGAVRTPEKLRRP